MSHVFFVHVLGVLRITKHYENNKVYTLSYGSVCHIKCYMTTTRILLKVANLPTGTFAMEQKKICAHILQ